MARERRPGNVSFVAGDYLDGQLPEGKYDLVTAVAVVHHADFGEAVDALVRLLAPGGRLVIVGNARDRTLLDAVVRLLPGCRFRRLHLRRYLLVWDKPR